MESTIDRTDIATGTADRPLTERRGQRLLRWLKQLIKALLLVIAALLVAGALYQAIATADDERNYPAPGQLVDVGGYKLHIHCTGQGSPTVVLESSLASTSSTWGWVQPAVALSTRVCAYDRAGAGWSDPGPTPRDGQRVSAELHALLGKAGIPGPYVLAGHSIGGLYVRAYAAQYPAEVAGLVLVDSSHPDQWLRTPGGQEQFNEYERFNSLGSILSRFGLLRLLNYFPANPDLPGQQSKELKAFNDSSKYTDINSAEFKAIPRLNDQVRGSAPLGSIPLLVLTATDHGYKSALTAGAPLEQLEQLQLEEEYWQEFQRELATLSSNSIQRVVDGADHSSLLLKQDHARTTSEAVLQVVETLRTGGRLAP